MWTPKRVLLLTAGLTFFFVGYLVYAFFLGGIDTLSRLPEQLLPSTGPIICEISNDDSSITRKLKQAFGDQCPQLTRPVRFEHRKKNLVVTAFDASFKEPDGRVKLTDFSMALFKDHGDYQFAEINTITSDFAFLKFDIPIKEAMDMQKGKIVQAELRGHILITNNHRSPERHDDLEVTVSNEALYYDDQSSRIWTDGVVKLLDKQTKPNPTQITGQGLELYLAKEEPKEQKQPATGARNKNEFSSVDRVVFKSTVEMHLYPDANSGFMSSPGAAPVKVAKDKETDKWHITISTYGPFVYDVGKDVARFASPPSRQESTFPDHVVVTRSLLSEESSARNDSKNDQLVCDHLTLKFRRRPEQLGNAKSSTTDREIESATATARAGEDVVLSLDSEKLDCQCLELIYQAPIGDRGARTVLRGAPLTANKDCHQIKATELTLVAANQKGQGQQMVAQGPGQVDLWDRSPGKGFTTHAIWKGLLTSTKYKEGDRDLDLLILNEDACFIQDEPRQELWGQRLQVWLESIEPPSKATPVQSGSDAGNGPRQKPWKVEAYERVKAMSADLRVQKCDRLTIRFKDVAGIATLLPPGGSVPPPERTAPLPQASAKTGPPASSPPSQAKDKDKPKKPIDLSASDVVVDVLRSGDKNELQELIAKGNVHVHQDPEKPQDKGVDVKGETLNLLHFDKGDILKVYGKVEANISNNRPAQLQLGELYLFGMDVTINQKENTAAVKGVGAMQMPSNATFDGGKTAKAGTRLTVHWTRDMLFDGRAADFSGGVVAYQEGSTMQCESLQVALDKHVSFKEGQKGEQAAKVEKVISHGKVAVFDTTKDNKDQIVKLQRLLSQVLVVDNPDNQVNATGPGQASIMQYGTSDGLTASTPGAPKETSKTLALMVTRVNFGERMLSTEIDPATRTRKSTFLGKVEVLHIPSNNLDTDYDPSRLPKGAMLLQCDRLTVLERPLPDGKTAQNMKAEQRVFCRTVDMYARAEVADFDKDQDTVIFRGSPGNPAMVCRQLTVGGEWQPVEAQTILYNRRSNTIQVDGAGVIRGALPAEDVLQPPELESTKLYASR